MKAKARPAWKDGNLVGKLIERLNAATEPTDGGSISFKTFDHAELFDLLADLVQKPGSLTEGDMAAISYRAFLDLRKVGEVSAKPLIAEIGKRAAQLMREPARRYTMWTKMRLKQMPFVPNSRFKIGMVDIRTAASLPRWLHLDRYFVSGVGDIDPNKPVFFGYLIFSVDARNENEAADEIFRAKEKFQAVVNTSWRSTEFFIQRSSTAVLLDGPYYFFFEKRKFIGLNKIWYSQEYDDREFSRFPKDAKNFLERADQIRRILKLLDLHPLRKQIERALILVNEGMKSSNLSFRLMRFWSAAEALYTSSSDRTNREKLISRMVFAETEDRLPIEQRKLERAYELRNAYVHHGYTDNDDTGLTQNLREFILLFAYYILFNGQDIETHHDLLLMIDPSSEPKKSEPVLRAIERRRLIMATGRHRPKQTHE